MEAKTKVKRLNVLICQCPVQPFRLGKLSKLEKRLQSSPNFALITEAALFDSLMMTLARLYDRSEKAKTIPALISRCKKNTNLFSSKQDALHDLEKFEVTLTQNEDISTAIEVLLHRRNNTFAHNDKKYFGKRIENDKKYLPMYKVWCLIDFTENVLNYLFSQLSSDERVQPKYDNDLENLFT